jgi:two-component sensor histidine kinase
MTRLSPETKKPSHLADRISLVQQLVPPILMAFTMFYEVTRHLIFPNVGNPALLVFEVFIFGLTAPAVLWLTLNWVGRQVRAREIAEGEADTRTRMLQEMHHRIKNNLQMVADLLSLELTRSEGRLSPESLRDSVARIKSIAVAHELLSADQLGAAEITGLARRIAESTRNALVRPDQHIAVEVDGPPILLDSKSATAFALVINELVSNALEHGLAARAEGHIAIELAQDADQVRVDVRDDGVGLREGFELSRDTGLGLRIARTLVEKDLRGALNLARDGGTVAEFSFRTNGVSL